MTRPFVIKQKTTKKGTTYNAKYYGGGNRFNKGVGVKRRVLGAPIVVNLNYKKGYRVSPGTNGRARGVQKCAKGKDLSTRKSCWKSATRSA